MPATRTLALAASLLLSGAAVAAPAPGQDALQQAQAAQRQGDTQAAVKLYQQAADAGNAEAEFKLGSDKLLNYVIGRDSGDREAAVKWLRKAADQGYVSAQLTLADVYGRDLYGVEDDAESFRRYQQAAATGSAEGEYHTGRDYEKGKGVAADIGQAISWYRKAAAQDDEIEQQIARDALLRLEPPGDDPIRQALHDGLVAADAGDNAAATVAFRRAATLGSADGQERLGEQLQEYIALSGIVDAMQDTASDESAKCKEMLDSLQRSAAQGDTRAMLDLADVYSHVWCLPKDAATARQWIEKAAALGDAAAKRRLGKLEKRH